jgi:hypothetical protein
MFKIQFSTSNAAFEGNPTRELEEITRILERVSEELGGGSRGGYIRDVNGNKIGTWKLT